MMKTFLAQRVSVVLMILFLSPAAFAGDAAVITFLKGRVFTGARETGPWQMVEKGTAVPAGRFIKTSPDGLVELTLPDRSMIRLAGSTVYGINQAVFQENDRRRFSGKLILGRVWSKINQSIGGLKGTFDIQTQTAAIGVRGTVFNVDAAADAGTEVSVFAGRVGVGPPLVAAGAAREEMAWPSEVSEKKWEEIILSRLQRLRIGADGKPGKPVPFDPEMEKDPWVDWNRERDAQMTATDTTP